MSKLCVSTGACKHNKQDKMYIPLVMAGCRCYAPRMTDVTRLALLCSLLGRVNGQLEQQVWLTRALFRYEFASLVEGLNVELFVGD
jgi:hypothetical protein